MPTLIRYPAFRTFETWRVEANNASEALLVSTRIAESDLARRVSLDGPSQPFRATYPSLVEPHAMSVPLSEALLRVQGSEAFLAGMAIPFVVAVYGEMLVDAARLLSGDGRWPFPEDPADLMLGPLRARLRSAGLTPPTDTESLIDFVQRLRNKIVHGGRVDRNLVDGWTRATPHAKAAWTRIAGQPRLVLGDRVQLTYRDVKATLAAAYRSVVEVNHGLGPILSRQAWSRIAVDDWLSQLSPVRSLYRDAALRKLGSYVRANYRPVGLSIRELGDEFLARPVWRADGLLPRRGEGEDGRAHACA
jgi:hypothetical protein